MNHPCLDPMICCQNSTENHMDVSENSGFSPPNHPFLIRFSMIFTIHFGGVYPYFWFNTHMKSWKPDVSWFPGFGSPGPNPENPPGTTRTRIRMRHQRWNLEKSDAGIFDVVVFWVCPSHSIQGAGIFIYVYHKNQPNVGVYSYIYIWFWVLVCNS